MQMKAIAMFAGILRFRTVCLVVALVIVVSHLWQTDSFGAILLY